MRRLFPALFIAAAVSACGQQPTEESVSPPVPVTDVQSKVTAEKAIAYVCERDMPITVIHGTNADGMRDAAVIIQGDYFPFVESTAPIDTGTRYISQQGVTKGNGLVWWVKGEEATIAEAPLDKIEDVSAAVVKRTCKEKN